MSKRAAQGENFRKLLLAIADDVRVLLVKLADRLHNMRTLQFMPPDKRRRIAEETLDIYAPLAGRMGIQEMREELEDLSFQNLDPEAYEAISRHLRELTAKNEKLVDEIERDLTAKLRRAGHRGGGDRAARSGPIRSGARWSANPSPSSSSPTSSASASSSGRIDECYRALGVVHTTWPMVPGRYKDYISTPKQNDYRSIHTTVIGPGSQRVELQIRTADMDEVAEYGIAAHALYKEGVNDNSRLAKESRAYQWLRRTIDLLAEGDNPEEFLEHTKLELFHDQVFCFTPKGRLIALPRGATPIDFAYAVHTDVGNTAVGCKINGRMAPLLTELQNGDEVEIVRAEGQTPPAAWESLVVTGKARASIRRATRAAVRRQYTGLGRQILERAFERAGTPLLGREAERRPAPPRARLRRGRAGGGRAAARCSPATWCGRSIPTTRTSGAAQRRRRQGRRGSRTARRERRGTTASRSAASTRTCRSASRPKAAPCRATASSAS